MDFRVKLKKQNPKIVAEIIRIAKAVQSLPTSEGYRDSIPRALIVGGFVRDAILGVASKDVDIEVFGVDAHYLEEAMNDLYPGKVKIVGRTFGVLKVILNSGSRVLGRQDEKNELSGYIEIDISIPRRESKLGIGHRGFAVTGDPVMSYIDASRRRDFTINAISVDLLTGEIIDPFDGQVDLKKKILRVVDPVTFVDDPLRVYRAIQFIARFQLGIDEQTKSLLRQMVERRDLDTLPCERVGEEMRKLLLKSEMPSKGFELAREIGLIKKDYPELEVMIGTEQEPEWHPEGDVWIHTMMVVDQAEKIIREHADDFSENEKWHVMLGALCHDLGKPAKTSVMDGRIRSHGHSEAGLEPTRILLEKFAVSNEDHDAVQKLVKAHLYPGMIMKAEEKGELTKEQYTNAVRKLIRRLYPVDVELLLAVAEADFRGRAFSDSSKRGFAYGNRMRKAIAKHDLKVVAVETLIRGEDCVIRGIAPGPRVGELIADVESARDRGEIATRKEGLAFLEKLLN
ncbi:MAG: HD domain-containing protein [bacterium]|nr:HD domain-containing protein [bacterium]